MDLNGDIIIADYDNRWVSIFSPEGKFKVSIWGGRRDLQVGISAGFGGPHHVRDWKLAICFAQ